MAAVFGEVRLRFGAERLLEVRACEVRSWLVSICVSGSSQRSRSGRVRSAKGSEGHVGRLIELCASADVCVVSQVASAIGKAAMAGGNSQNPGGVQPEGNVLQQSHHPTALMFHVGFKAAALMVYLFGGLFSKSFVVSFVIVVLLLAFDFWTVKNVSGRLLVGLRWWNEVREDGTNEWRFESREDTSRISDLDSRVFWLTLWVMPILWSIFTVSTFFSFNYGWMLCCLVCSHSRRSLLCPGDLVTDCLAAPCQFFRQSCARQFYNFLSDAIEVCSLLLCIATRNAARGLGSKCRVHRHPV